MEKNLLLFAFVGAAIYGVQFVLTNKKGAEAATEADLANVIPPAWHFVALEYCYGMLNRTYIVFVSDAMICGACVRARFASGAPHAR